MIDLVTARYAEALFNLAQKQGVLEAVSADVEKLAGEFANPAVASFFFDARVSVEARREKLGSLLGELHETTRNFCNLLFDKRREEILRDLGAAWKSRLLAERGEAEGVVESARPMSDDEVSRLADSMGARLGKKVSLENRVNSDLIGGVRVLVESQMLDRSYSGHLEGLRKRMLEAPLSASSDA